MDTNGSNGWNLTILHRRLMDAAKTGGSYAAILPTVRKQALEARSLEQAFDGPVLDGAQRDAAYHAARLGGDAPAGHGERLGRIVQAATEAAMVTGARSLALLDDGSRRSNDWPRLASNELVHEDGVDELLRSVVSSIEAARIPLPGARGYLSRIRGHGAARIHYVRDREARTDWISDADTARPYQLIVKRDRGQVRLARRFRGSRSCEALGSIQDSDLSAVIELLQLMCGA